MSSITSPVFTGTSSFATDFIQIINRAVGIASLPLHQLQGQLTTLTNQSDALSRLDTKFAALETAIRNLGGGTGVNALTATSSDTSFLTANVASGAFEGTFTVDVLDAGTFSTAISNNTLPVVDDPTTKSISTSSNYTLTVNGNTFAIAPGGAGLNDLALAINQAHAGVHASLVNTGNSGSPSYRLYLRSDSLAPDTIQLSDGSQNLLGTLTTGTPASYQVNGLATPIESSSRTVTLAPGITATLIKATTAGSPVTVTVARDTEKLSTAISNYVTAYNDAVTELDTHVGTAAGALSGQSVIHNLYQSLSKLNQYSGTGTIANLAQMGVEVDSTGRLSFNSSRFDAATIDDLQIFLGSATGGGFLTAASTIMDSVEDPTTGSVQQAIHLIKDQITHQNDLIADSQQRITDLQTHLQEKLAAADALLSQLETKKNYFNNLFTAMLNYNLNGAGVKA